MHVGVEIDPVVEFSDKIKYYIVSSTDKFAWKASGIEGQILLDDIKVIKRK